jgi:large conductance mechanosensitive channel
MSTAKGFLKEFREFAVKGNMIDLAIGVIIGAAFGKIIDSIVGDLIMPVINFVIGSGVNFDNLFWVLRTPAGYSGSMTIADLTKAGGVVFAWGHFLTVAVNFILLALVVFMLVKLVNNARRRFEEPAPTAPVTPENVLLLREIRDALKK